MITETLILAAVGLPTLCWAVVCVVRTDNQTLDMYNDAFSRRHDLIKKGMDHEAVPYPPERDLMHFFCLFFLIDPSRIYQRRSGK